MTAVERDGEPVAAIVHDEALLKERDALEAIATATRLAASNDRLHTELRVQLDELEASRQRLRVAEDDARRRLEERLERSGAARIRAAVAMLGEAATVTSRAGTTTIAEIRADTSSGAAEATLAGTSGALARGLYPRESRELGFGPALTELAGRSEAPVPSHERGGGGRSGRCRGRVVRVLRSARDVNRHAAASSVDVTVQTRDGWLTITVQDDGVGGADRARGSGLDGLTGRLATAGGELLVDSPRGRGSRITATIPVRGAHVVASIILPIVASNDVAMEKTPACTDGSPDPRPHGGHVHPHQGDAP